jgi:hypothetical protein
MPDEIEVSTFPSCGVDGCLRQLDAGNTVSPTLPSPELTALASTAPTKIFHGSGPGQPRVVLADEERCILHAMPTLQQRGLRRPMDLAGRTAETAARSPKFLSRGCHSDPRAAL